MANCDTCNNKNLVNDPYDSTYVLTAQPQFLKQYFKVISPSVFYFKDPNSLVIKVNTSIGSSWIFDSTAAITATTIAKQQQFVLGNLDSVCFIKLSTNDTILLSKHFGLVQFPFTTITKHSYKLAGIETPNSFCGTKLKRFRDFFSFNIKDVFQFEFFD